MLNRSVHRAAAALLLLIGGCGGERPPPEGEAGVPEPFRGTARIILTREGRGQKVEAHISDPNTVEEFLAAIQLVPKEPCLCDHNEEAIFEKGDSPVRVSLCNHCFDFSGRHYRMPERFYQLFQREIGKATEPSAPSAK